MTRTLDIAGTEITVPDPHEITGLSGRFRAMGDALADVQDQLSALASPQAWSQWTGPAAAAFGQTIGQVPGRLGAAQESYHEVAAALSGYADQVRPVVATLSSLATRAGEAVGNLTATQAARDRSVSQLVPAPSPALVGWDAQVTAARAAVEEIQAQACTQQSELKALAAGCVTRISQALPGGPKKNQLPGGPKKNQGLLGGLRRDFGKLARGELEVFDDLLIRPFTDLGDDAGKLLKGDLSLANIGKALGDVAGVLGILAFIPVVDTVAAPAAFVVGGIAAGVDLAARFKHEKDVTYTDVGFAAAGAGLGVLDRAFDGAAAAKELADGTHAQASGTALLKAGIKHVADWSDVKATLDAAANRVKQSLGDESSGINLPGKEQLRTAAKNVSDTFADRSTKALHLGADGESDGSPAARTYQHLAFVTTRAGELATVTQDQLNSSDESQAPGSD